MKHNTFTLPFLQLAAAIFVGRTEAAPVAEAASALIEPAPNPYVEEAVSGSDTSTESLSPRTANVNPHAKDGSGLIRAAGRRKFRYKHSCVSK